LWMDLSSNGDDCSFEEGGSRGPSLQPTIGGWHKRLLVLADIREITRNS